MSRELSTSAYKSIAFELLMSVLKISQLFGKVQSKNVGLNSSSMTNFKAINWLKIEINLLKRVDLGVRSL